MNITDKSIRQYLSVDMQFLLEDPVFRIKSYKEFLLHRNEASRFYTKNDIESTRYLLSNKLLMLLFECDR